MPDEASPLSVSLITALEELTAALPMHQAEYALIGGIAVGIRGRKRYTEDIDLLVSVPQLRLPGLLEDLQRRGFTLDEMATIREWTQHHMVVIEYRGVRVDLLKPVLPAYRHVIDRATAEPWRGRELWLATAEALILLKLTASRNQDIADIEMLLAANRGRLDLDWVEAEWRTMFPTDDPRWQRFTQLRAEYYDRSTGPG